MGDIIGFINYFMGCIMFLWLVFCEYRVERVERYFGFGVGVGVVFVRYCCDYFLSFGDVSDCCWVLKIVYCFGIFFEVYVLSYVEEYARRGFFVVDVG